MILIELHHGDNVQRLFTDDHDTADFVGEALIDYAEIDCINIIDLDTGIASQQVKTIADVVEG